MSRCRWKQDFAEKWLESQSGDPNTRASMQSQLKLHAFPRIGTRPLGSFQPRHFYASVLLDAGESIKAVSEYLGHSDPGLTLKVYAHLMPSSSDRARKALGKALRPDDPPR